jgi:hypothetical protein
MLFGIVGLFTQSELIDSFSAFLCRPNANGSLYRGYEDFSVANFACPGAPDHHVNGSFRLLVANHDFDFDLGQAVSGIFAPAEYLGVTSLAAIAFDFGDSHSGDACLGQGGYDLLKFMRPDDSFDLFHRAGRTG